MRNKLLSAGTILIIALMLFVFNLILALNLAAESVIGSVGSKVDIVVEIKEGVEDYSIQAFLETLRTRKEIKEIIYIRKEEALQSFGSKYPNIISFLEHYQLKNPLPNSVRLVTRSIAENSGLIEHLESPQFAPIINQEKLASNLEQKSRNEKIVNVTRFISRASFWLNLVFALVSLMILFNSLSINITHHRDEIQIMKLVGAQYSFIRTGFILEGAMLGLGAFLLSILFSQIMLSHLAKKIISVLSNEAILAGMNAILLNFEDRFWLTFSWQLAFILAASGLSSYLAIELYLRKNSQP